VEAQEATSAPCQPSNSVSECWEIKKLTEQFREKIQQQLHQDSTHSRQQEGKQKRNPHEEKDIEMEFQDAKRALNAVYDHSNYESSDNEHRKALHVMFGGSWDITSQRIVKTLRQEIVAVAPVPKTTPHRKWMETPIGFDASDCPKSMAGAGQLPLLVSPTIATIKLYHVLIDGGATLNLISLAAFKKLQILMPRGCITLSVTFGTPNNFCTESIFFDVTEVSLPFNVILGRPTLYQFMVVVHYGYLVLKIPSPNGVLKIRGDHDAEFSALEKLQALAVAREAAAEPGGRDLGMATGWVRVG
jgi:hypothetical protein